MRLNFGLRGRTKRAFTLIELLVVMVIIGILVALLIPAVNAARGSAQSTQSKNNLRQIALAMNVFRGATGYFPPSAEFGAEPGTAVDNAPWSIHALLLPYLEQKVLSEDVDFSLPYSTYVGAAAPTFAVAGEVNAKRLGNLRVPTYLSPAEPRDEPRGLDHYPVNYAVNLGSWLVFDPATGNGGNGAAYPGSRLRDGSFYDGMSTTLAFAEVKGWQPYLRNTALTPGDVPPATVAALGTMLGGTSGSGAESWANGFKIESGHTEWIDGRAHQIGFTSVFAPNQKVRLATADTAAPGATLTATGTGNIDIDWNNWQEGKQLHGTASAGSQNKTYAAITARSYFKGAVNVAMVDGSVRGVADNVNINVWRAISTRNGKERLPSEFGKQ